MFVNVTFLGESCKIFGVVLFAYSLLSIVFFYVHFYCLGDLI